MKKLILMIAVAASLLSSCKKEVDTVYVYPKAPVSTLVDSSRVLHSLNVHSAADNYGYYINNISMQSGILGDFTINCKMGDTVMVYNYSTYSGGGAGVEVWYKKANGLNDTLTNYNSNAAQGAYVGFKVK